MPGLTDEEYRRLLEFRTGLRRFLRWSEAEAARAGLSPAQHQLLLAIRGRSDPGGAGPGGDGAGSPRGPRIGELAEELLLRHHSVVELVDRAEAAGLVRREGDPADHRYVRVTLTGLGARRLDALATTHVEELRRLAPRFQRLWEGLDGPGLGDGREQDVLGK
jgi:DNA-binding MarR family transcriptional regulator